MDATAIKVVTQLQTHTYKHMLSRPSPWSLQSTPIAAQPQVPLCVISQVEKVYGLTQECAHRELALSGLQGDQPQNEKSSTAISSKSLKTGDLCLLYSASLGSSVDSANSAATSREHYAQ